MKENKDLDPVDGENPDVSEGNTVESGTASDTLSEDIEELRRDFPELRDIESVTELSNPIRYAALRDIGLSASEAYLLTSHKLSRSDTRSHLTSSVPKAAKSPETGLGKRELEELRELFGEISDADIYKLYKKVTM